MECGGQYGRRMMQWMLPKNPPVKFAGDGWVMTSRIPSLLVQRPSLSCLAAWVQPAYEGVEGDFFVTRLRRVVITK